MFKSNVKNLIPIYVENRHRKIPIFPPRYTTQREEQRKNVTLYFFHSIQIQQIQQHIFDIFSLNVDFSLNFSHENGV